MDARTIPRNYLWLFRLPPPVYHLVPSLSSPFVPPPADRDRQDKILRGRSRVVMGDSPQCFFLPTYGEITTGNR